LIDAVSDDEILAAYKLLASKEGVFVEPASAASVAGILKLAKNGFFTERRTTNHERRIRIVCVLTGHGLKDPDRAIASVEAPKAVEPKLEAVLKEIW
jgi:threonine synthase